MNNDNVDKDKLCKKVKMGVIKELYSKGLISPEELQKCIEILIRKDAQK